MQDVREHRLMFGEFEVIPCEVGMRAETDNVDALTVLGHEVLPVDDFPVHLIAQFILQSVNNDLERAALVVRGQILHVLQQERRRSLRRDDAGHVEEQRALRLVAEPGLTA